MPRSYSKPSIKELPPEEKSAVFQALKEEKDKKEDREQKETLEKIIFSAFFQLCDYYRAFKEMKPETWLKKNFQAVWAREKIEPAKWQEKELAEAQQEYQKVLSELETVLNCFFASPFIQSIFKREFGREIHSLAEAERISQQTMEPFFQQFKKTEPKTNYQQEYTSSKKDFQNDFFQALIKSTEDKSEWDMVVKKLTLLPINNRRAVQEYFKVKETDIQKQKTIAIQNILCLGDSRRFETRNSKWELDEEGETADRKEQELTALISQTSHLKLVLQDYQTKWLPKLEQTDQPFIMAQEKAKREAEEKARKEKEAQAKAEAEKRAREEAEWKAKNERGEVPRSLVAAINPDVFEGIRQTNHYLKDKERKVHLDFEKIRERAINLYLKAEFHKELEISEEEYKHTFPRLGEHLTPEKLTLIKEKVKKEGFNDILIVDNRLPLSKQFELLIKNDKENFPNTWTFSNLDAIKELNWSKITPKTEITKENIQEFQKDKEPGFEIVLVQKYQFTHTGGRCATATSQIKKIATEGNTGLTLENYLVEIKNFLKEEGKYMDMYVNRYYQNSWLLGSVSGVMLPWAYWHSDYRRFEVNANNPGNSEEWLAGRRRVVLKKIRT